MRYRGIPSGAAISDPHHEPPCSNTGTGRAPHHTPCPHHATPCMPPMRPHAHWQRCDASSDTSVNALEVRRATPGSTCGRGGGYDIRAGRCEQHADSPPSPPPFPHAPFPLPTGVSPCATAAGTARRAYAALPGPCRGALPGHVDAFGGRIQQFRCCRLAVRRSRG